MRTEPIILKQQVRQGRPYVVIYTEDGTKTTKRVHKLVAESFIPNPHGKAEVAHWDGNTFNNCAQNLRWATRRENNDDKYRHGTNGFKLTEEMATAIRTIYETGDYTQAEVGRMFGVGRTTVGAIVRNETWKQGKSALLERIT